MSPSPHAEPTVPPTVQSRLDPSGRMARGSGRLSVGKVAPPSTIQARMPMARKGPSPETAQRGIPCDATSRKTNTVPLRPNRSPKVQCSSAVGAPPRYRSMVAPTRTSPRSGVANVPVPSGRVGSGRVVTSPRSVSPIGGADATGETNGCGEGLRRFTRVQRTSYDKALREIKAGKKQSCWMWYVIPTPPYIVDGIERGSDRNRRYALRTPGEVNAYLNFVADGVNLRSNYFGIMEAVRDRLRSGQKPLALMGCLDEPKLRSSARLFEKTTREGVDEELHELLMEVLSLLRENQDP
eukprot:TRINITY_DN7620_c0_g1_i3.p1 TRINITY_DN7620_c0_g1~~TRINITY_DN7620_c0_g1_i3.p1  ORF type:complete len:296 (-),score=26.56 TRINITY_DN7620_c0_g1_i3:144-1031(-)